MAGNTAPATFTDAMAKVSADLGAALMLPDSDPKLVITLMMAIKGSQAPKGQPGGQAGAAPPGGPGGAPGGPLGGAGGPGAPPGMAPPGGPPGGSPQNGQMPSMGPPKGPQNQNGLTQGLSPNPDEMRRVIQQSTAG